MSFTSTPLYAQIREELLRRLIDGRWPPGTMLPSQQELAGEFGISQGTVRKALEALAGENLIHLKKGRGTFVVVPDEGRLLFQFFRLQRDDGGKSPPMSKVHRLRKAAADAITAAHLGLGPRDHVWELDRTRNLEGRPVIREKLFLPAIRFPAFDQIETLPNSIYSLYSLRYGITVGRAIEKLKAIKATAHDIAVLGCAPGTALLSIDRVGYALDGSPVERRVSHCITEGLHYMSNLHQAPETRHSGNGSLERR